MCSPPPQRLTCAQSSATRASSGGDAQARRYVAVLERGIASLAAGRVGREMSTLFPALRMARCEHHYVFCLPREGEPPLIVAILHERMDSMARLVDRLND